jgi:hypothetical protein
MSTQNGPHLEISWKRNFDSHLGVKVTALWSLPIRLYREAMHLQSFRSTWWAGLRAHINLTTFTRFTQNWSMRSLLAVTVSANGSLIFDSVGSSHNGTYTCWAVSSGGASQKHAKLNVTDKKGWVAALLRIIKLLSDSRDSGQFFFLLSVWASCYTILHHNIKEFTYE